MFADTVDATALVAEKKFEALRTSVPRYLVMSALAGAYVGLGIALIFALGAPLSDESKKRITAFSHQRLAEMIPDRIDTSARLANFGLPSLMICGTNDARFEGMRRFAATRDCYRFVPVQDADHLQAWFRSDRIVSEIQGFVRTVSA